MTMNPLKTTPHSEKYSPPGTPALLSSPTNINCGDAPQCGNRLTTDGPPQFILPPYEFYLDGLLPQSEFMNEIDAFESLSVLDQF
jgi:hypothetical protein